MIQQGWREQYDRMRRSYEHLVAVASGKSAASSDTARDALFHFFQDAYHLKDWLRNDPALALGKADKQRVEDAITNSPNLTACADLCNGTKHRVVASRIAGATGATLAAQDFTAHAPPFDVATAMVGPDESEPPPGGGHLEFNAAAFTGPPGFTTHGWTVQTGAGNLDAVVLAGQVLTDWDQWLTSEKLL